MIALVPLLAPTASARDAPSIEVPVSDLRATFEDYGHKANGVLVGGDWNTLAEAKAAARPLGLQVIRAFDDDGAEILAALARTGLACGLLVRTHTETIRTVYEFGNCGRPIPEPPPVAVAPAPPAPPPGPAQAPPQPAPPQPAPPQPAPSAPVAKRSVAFVRLLVLDDELLVGDAAETYRLFLMEQARQAGLVVPTTSVLFERASEQDADLQVGAVLSVACTNPIRSCELTADWEALDTASGKVVYTTRTRNEAASRLTVVEASRSELQHALLSGALARLVARPGFQQILNPPVGAADGPPTWTAPLPVARCAPAAVPSSNPLSDAVGASVVVSAGSKVGSGVCISPDGYVLTAAHVVDDASEVDVRIHSGLSLTAKVIRVDTSQDTAVIDVAGAGHACAPVAVADLPVGAPVLAVGSPLGAALGPSVTRGIASSYRTIEGRRWLQTDAAVNPGNSGGPLFSDTGEVAAIVSFKMVGSAIEGIGFGAPAPDVLRRLDITLGDASAPDPLPLAGRRGPGSVVARSDPEDPSMFDPDHAVRPASTVRYWTPAERRGVGVAAGAAVAFALGGFASYGAGRSADTMDGWRTGSVVNSASWTLSGVALGVMSGLVVHSARTEVSP